MKAKRVLLILLVCALALLILSPAATAKSHERPFKGVLTGEADFGPGPAFGLPDNPNPPFMYTVTFAGGEMSHMGKCDWFAHHPTPPGDVTAYGSSVLTAANGDQIFVDYSSYGAYPVPGVPSTIHGTGEFSITGGTGRFHDASGSGEIDFDVEFSGDMMSPDPWPGVWYLTGTISY